MVSINRKLVVAIATGFVIGTALWLVGTIALSVVPTLPAVTPLASFGMGFGGSLAATLSEDSNNGEKK